MGGRGEGAVEVAGGGKESARGGGEGSESHDSRGYESRGGGEGSGFEPRGAHDHRTPSEERLQILGQFCAASVAGVHRDERANGRAQPYLLFFEDETVLI